MTTMATARGSVASLINTAWLAAPASSGVLMLWDNVKGDRPGEDGATTQALPWARTTIRMTGSPQVTLGRRRFETSGVVTVQIFTPFGDGNQQGDLLSQVVLDALRGHIGSVDGLWFFDIDANEIGASGAWFQTNVSASLRFQELAP